jgi:hypothetical protein
MTGHFHVIILSSFREKTSTFEVGDLIVPMHPSSFIIVPTFPIIVPTLCVGT